MFASKIGPKVKVKVKKKKPNSEQSFGAIDVDPISSILHDDADDMTLAGFINRRLPKRRLKPAKHEDQDGGTPH